MTTWLTSTGAVPFPREGGPYSLGPSADRFERRLAGHDAGAVDRVRVVFGTDDGRLHRHGEPAAVDDFVVRAKARGLRVDVVDLEPSQLSCDFLNHVLVREADVREALGRRDALVRANDPSSPASAAGPAGPDRVSVWVTRGEAAAASGAEALPAARGGGTVDPVMAGALRVLGPAVAQPVYVPDPRTGRPVEDGTEAVGRAGALSLVRAFGSNSSIRRLTIDPAAACRIPGGQSALSLVLSRSSERDVSRHAVRDHRASRSRPLPLQGGRMA